MAIFRDGGPVGTPRKKHFRRIFPWIVGLLVAGLLVGGGLWVLSLDTASTPPVTSEAIDRGEYTPDQVIETDWFRFSAPKAWQYAEELSKPGMFVYRDIVGQNPTGIMTVYINKQPLTEDNWFTNIVPVSVRDQTSLSATEISDHCKTSVPNKKSRDPQPVQVLGVAFTCYTDGSNFYAAAGEIDGTTTLKMLRSDFTEISYVITYRNIAFNDNRSVFRRVLSSFESR